MSAHSTTSIPCTFIIQRRFLTRIGFRCWWSPFWLSVIVGLLVISKFELCLSKIQTFLSLVDFALAHVLNLVLREVFLGHAYILRDLFSIFEILHFLFDYLLVDLSIIFLYLLTHVVFLIICDVWRIHGAKIEICSFEVLQVFVWSSLVDVVSSQKLCVKCCSTGWLKNMCTSTIGLSRFSELEVAFPGELDLPVSFDGVAVHVFLGRSSANGLRDEILAVRFWWHFYI